MEITVSTSIAGLLRSVSLPEALDTITLAGFQAVDFPLSVFSRPADSPLKSERWISWVDALRKDLNRRGLRVTQAHASWEQAIAEDFSFEDTYPVYERTIMACRMLGCQKLVFHAPLYFFPTEDQAARRRVTDWNIRWFTRLLPVLEDNGVTACIENTFDYRRVRRPQDPPFIYTSGEDMYELAEGIHSPCVKLCLDTGHANISGQNVPQMIRDYGPYLEVLHLNDNLGLIGPVYEDLHLFPGHGTLPWDQIFKSLREVHFSGVFNLEPVDSLSLSSPALRVLQFEAAKKTVTLLAKEAGY